VYGLSNVYIADASVMPTLPSANTNLPMVMLAERLASAIQRG
jgi:choline dehydrogenase-like flavoprotein